MPIQQLLRDQQHFGPEDINVLSSAFEEALQTLGLVDRTVPVRTAEGRSELIRNSIPPPKRPSFFLASGCVAPLHQMQRSIAQR